MAVYAIDTIIVAPAHDFLAPAVDDTGHDLTLARCFSHVYDTALAKNAQTASKEVVECMDARYWKLLGLSVFEATMVRNILIAALLGALAGWERQTAAVKAQVAQNESGRAACGVRTLSLICAGSCMFTLLSVWGFNDGPNLHRYYAEGAKNKYDTARVAAQIVSGVGFLGAGVMIKGGASVKGVTTAAAIWATAAVGMAVGVGQVVLAVVFTLVMVWLAMLNRSSGADAKAQQIIADGRVSTLIVPTSIVEGEKEPPVCQNV